MTAPQRWEPDAQMVAAVLSMPKASRKMTELSDADRSWLVAGLTLAGVTAQDIADRLSCSLRLVRAIRAEDMTQMAYIAQDETRKLGDDLRVERCEHSVTRRTLAEAEAENSRLRMQLDQLVDAIQAGSVDSFRCGHPRVKYNVYSHGGKQYCRECRRQYQAQRRKGLIAV
ncbi:hypothetical protein [Mycolicibacterium fortuitum]|uniref:hypothetical protein n=1 Tax=Mycolicibacterium fortuitum TaxID=1766 RepID=UPI00096D0F07|nr:hypothetical protein [Mycolicibacterium fortuitum]OMC08541.1 hypothetical protein A5734_01785 [Mycolicibacterium fortuitum]